jgi:hypothetical protein
MVTAAQLRWSHELHEGQQLLCRHNREESDPLLGMPDLQHLVGHLWAMVRAVANWRCRG